MPNRTDTRRGKVSLFISILLFVSNSLLAKQYKLTPLVGLGSPVDRGVTVTFGSPGVWQEWKQHGEKDSPYMRIFVLPGHADDEHPAIQLSIRTWVPGDLYPGPTKEIDRKDPWNSSTVTNMKGAAPIKDLRKIESFDSGENGRLPIWQIRSEAYDNILALLVYRHTSVDICLRADDSKNLRQYIPDLKSLARSVRFSQSGH